MDNGFGSLSHSAHFAATPELPEPFSFFSFSSSFSQSFFRTQPSSFTPDNEPVKNQWFWFDIPLMARLTGSSPVLIDALFNEQKPNQLPIGGQTTVNLRNTHLNYAITWFCLSAATTAMIFFRKSF